MGNGLRSGSGGREQSDGECRCERDRDERCVRLASAHACILTARPPARTSFVHLHVVHSFALVAVELLTRSERSLRPPQLHRRRQRRPNGGSIGARATPGHRDTARYVRSSPYNGPPPRPVDRIVPIEEALIAGENGGGGNRTRVRGRTGMSIYKHRPPLRFARRPVGDRPTDELALLRCRAPGEWLSVGAEPAC